MVGWCDYLDGVGCFAYAQVYVVAIALTASVEGDEEVARTTFDTELHFGVVAKDDGSHVE